MGVFPLLCVVVLIMLQQASAGASDATLYYAYVAYGSTYTYLACWHPATPSANFYAVSASLLGSGVAMSEPAPLVVGAHDICGGIAPRLAVDRASGRVWHMVSTFNKNSTPAFTRIIVEWAVTANASQPPTYVAACAFEGSSTQQADVRIFSHDSAVFQSGPYYVRPLDGSIVGLTVHAPAIGESPSRSVGALPACDTTIVATIPLAFVNDSLLMDDGFGASLSPIALYLSPPALDGSGLSANATALSLTTGAVLWTAAVSAQASGRGNRMAAELHGAVIFRRQLLLSSECFDGGRLPVYCSAYGVVNDTAGLILTPFVPTNWGQSNALFSAVWTDSPPRGDTVDWPAYRVDINGAPGVCHAQNTDALVVTITTIANASMAAVSTSIVLPNGGCTPSVPPPAGGASACLYFSFAVTPDAAPAGIAATVARVS